MRFFNTSGPVVAADHYCVPPLERIDLSDILSLIGTKRYFVLHAPRQTGKTSALLALRDLLNGGSPRQVPLRLRKRRGRPGGTRRPSGSDARHPQRTGSRGGGCAATEGHLVIFDRTADKPWNDKVFCRTENAAGVPITVWGM